ncbi:MAG: glycosyltransferase [Ignavibacteriaceae bacterium]
MSIIIGIIASIFILILPGCVILIALKKSINNAVNITQDVNISVIISARNEKEKIEKLVNTLNNLNYPQDKYEVIIVDDNSRDGTLEELKLQIDKFNNFRVLDLKPAGLRGKREALSLGIQHSQHPYLVITDADCRPQSNWLVACSRKFALGYDMLFGIAPFYQNKTLTNRIACFENLRSSLLSFSLAIVGFPYTAAARNFGFTRNAFDLLSGYSKTKDTLSGDDDLLLREAVKRKLKIGVVTDSDSYVYSETKKTFREYFHQRARHTQTSFHYLKKHQVILVFWHLLNLLLLFSPLLMFIDPLLGFLLPAKLLTDFTIIKSTQNKFGYRFSVIEIIYLQIFYELLLIIHFFNARFSEIKWK